MGLLALLAIAVLAGGTLPQEGRLSGAELDAWRGQWPVLSRWFEASGLSAIHASNWFLVLCLLLTLALAVGMALHFQRMRDWLGGQTQPARRLAAAGPLPPGLARVFPSGEGFVVRGRAGAWGLLLFHCGVAVIIVAGLVSGSNRFAAHLELAEGESFDGRRDKLVLEGGEAPAAEEMGFRLRLDRLVADIRGGDMRELQAWLSYQQKNAPLLHSVLEVNHPLKIGDYTLTLDKTLGRTAMLERILPEGGRRLLLINFPVPRAEWGLVKPLERKQVVMLENRPVSFSMTLLPGASPSFRLVTDWRGKTTFSGILTPGMEADVGPYRLVFRGEAPWVGLYLASDRAQMAVFAGFALALSGFALHLLFAPRRLRLYREGEQWVLEGWARGDDWRFERRWREWEASVKPGEEAP